MAESVLFFTRHLVAETSADFGAPGSGMEVASSGEEAIFLFASLLKSFDQELHVNTKVLLPFFVRTCFFSNIIGKLEPEGNEPVDAAKSSSYSCSSLQFDDADHVSHTFFTLSSFYHPSTEKPVVSGRRVSSC